MNKILKLILLTILLISICTGCSTPATRYLHYRLSPDRTPTTGNIESRVPGLEKSVTIYFDQYAVPHIQASDEYSLYYAFGYIQSRDRRFEMEVMRLVALGRLRELVGEQDSSGTVKKLEIFSRMVGMYEDGQAFVKNATETERTIVQAYSDGVNAATAIEPIPMEFRLMEYTPRPWTPEDVGAILALVAFGLTKNWEMELARLELIINQIQTGGSIDRALSIWKPRYYMPPYLIGEDKKDDPFADYPPVVPELESYLMENFSKATPDVLKKAAMRDTASDFPLAPLLKGLSSSNNWALSGEWTQTGKGAIASDPHMPQMMPSMGYLAHIQCTDCEDGDYNVIGATFAGFPGIPFGTNGFVGWSSTSNWGDISDVYVEKTVPGNPGYYEYMGKAEPFKVREEVFKIRQKDGTFKTETMVVRETRHGVVINDFVERIPDHFPVVVLKRVRDSGHPITSQKALYFSKDVNQARTALFGFYNMVQHWSLADATGNVLYTGPFLLPIRENHLGTLPVPGWTDKYEWNNYCVPEKIPFLFNPERGWVGTANSEVIHPDTLGFPINFEGNITFRFRRMSSFLDAGNNGKPLPEQIGRQQMDNVDEGWRDVRALFQKGLSPLENDLDPMVATATKILMKWDGKAEGAQVAPALYNTLLAHVLKRTMEDEVSEETMHFMLTYLNIEPVAFGIFGHADNPAWDDRKTPEIEKPEDVIAKCFRESVASLASRYGDEPEKWTWSDVAPMTFPHPFGTDKTLAKYVNRTVPTNGSTDTIYKQQFERVEMNHFPIVNGPVLRIMLDLNDMANSRMSLPGGQSGRPSSPHYDDQIRMFITGDGTSMEMDMEKIKSRAAGTLVLTPK